jgi:hypothetical protein
MERYDLSSLTVTGDPNDVSSFAACLTAVLQAWGREVAYKDIVGLNGIAFSPVWDQGEDCTAWWMEGGDDMRLDFLGQALGFSYETVTREQDFWMRYATHTWHRGSFRRKSPSTSRVCTRPLRGATG